MSMDIKTITALYNEALRRKIQAEKAFDKYDNSEDMHEMEAWAQAVEWLKDKLPAET